MRSQSQLEPNPPGLKDELTEALSKDFRCKVYYVHTASKRCDPIFSSPPGLEPEITNLTSHFLTISINNDDNSKNDVFVLGIEVLVYATKHLTTIFVSKADSTGYLPKQQPSAAKAIITTFVHWLAKNEGLRHPGRKLVISLFARSQSQYLFPGSAENSGKHILDDRQLIKWWVHVLDPLFPAGKGQRKESARIHRGYLTVPGYEGASEHRAFLPSQNTTADGHARWTTGNPLAELARTKGLPESVPTRCLLPRFPDDPKARFIRDLDDEAGFTEEAAISNSPKKSRSGQWINIRDLDRFWEAMSFRQECSSGRVVGFIWLVEGAPGDTAEETKVEPNADVQLSPNTEARILSSDSIDEKGRTGSDRNGTKRKRRKKLVGPIIARQPRLKGDSSSLTASDLGDMLQNETEIGLLLTPEGYDSAMESLLHLDFANIDVARQSTSKWVSEVSRLGGAQGNWAVEVVGTKTGEKEKNVFGNAHANTITDLSSMIRKRRKAEDEPTGEGAGGTPQQPAVNVLGAGMIRKKPKPAAT